jgi:hypothetical protein
VNLIKINLKSFNDSVQREIFDVKNSSVPKKLDFKKKLSSSNEFTTINLYDLLSKTNIYNKLPFIRILSGLVQIVSDECITPQHIGLMLIGKILDRRFSYNLFTNDQYNFTRFLK